MVDLDALLAEIEPAPVRVQSMAGALDLDALLATVERAQRAGPPPVPRVEEFPRRWRSLIERRRALHRRINDLYEQLLVAQGAADLLALWTPMMEASEQSQAIVQRYARQRGQSDPGRFAFWRAGNEPMPEVSPISRQMVTAWAGRQGWFVPGLSPRQAIVLSRELWSVFKNIPDEVLLRIVRDPVAHRDDIRALMGHTWAGYRGGTAMFPGTWWEVRGRNNPVVTVKVEGEPDLVLSGNALADLAAGWLRGEAKGRALI